MAWMLYYFFHFYIELKFVKKKKKKFGENDKSVLL